MEQILKDVFAVEVPLDADPNEWKIFNVDAKSYLNGLTEDGEMYAGLDPLPPGSYEILFTTLSCTEDQAAGVVSQVLNGFYENYLTTLDLSGFEGYDKATESLQSLLRSKNLDPAKNYLLIRKL